MRMPGFPKNGRVPNDFLPNPADVKALLTGAVATFQQGTTKRKSARPNHIGNVDITIDMNTLPFTVRLDLENKINPEDWSTWEEALLEIKSIAQAVYLDNEMAVELTLGSYYKRERDAKEAAEAAIRAVLLKKRTLSVAKFKE